MTITAPPGSGLPAFQEPAHPVLGRAGKLPPCSPSRTRCEEYGCLVGRTHPRRVLDDIRQRTGGADQRRGSARRPDTSTAVAAYQRQFWAFPDSRSSAEKPPASPSRPPTDHVMIIDGGSGIRNASKHLVRNWGDRRAASHALHDPRTPRPPLRRCRSATSAMRGRNSTSPSTAPASTSMRWTSRYGIFSREFTPQIHDDDPIDFRVMSAAVSGIENFATPPSRLRSRTGECPWARAATCPPI